MAVRAAILAFLALGAFAVRACPAGDLVGGPIALPFPDDPPYHWMRLERMLAGPVDPTAPDPSIAHPHGAVAHWPWGFDLLLATLSAAAGAGTDAEAARRVTAWSIPLMGALTVLLAYAAAARMTSRRRALLAAALAALVPAHVEYTLAGRVDHHVMEPLLTLLALWGPLVAAGAPRAGPQVPAGAGSPKSRGPLLATALSGLVLGFSFAFYPAALHPVTLALAFAGGGLALALPGCAVAYAAGAMVGMAASLPLSPHPLEWVFYSPSLVHLVLVGVGCAGVAGVAAATRLRPRWTALARLSLGALAGAVVAALAGLLVPAFPASVLEGFRYLGSSAIAALSFEARPLLSEPDRAIRMLGLLSPFAPVGLLLLARRNDEDGRETPLPVRAIALLGLALVAVALAQRRFVVVATPFVAIGAAEGLARIGRLLAPFLRRAGVRPALLAVGAGAIVVAGLLFDLSTVAEYQPLVPRDRAILKASDVIASRMREVPSPGAGALVPWGYGHLVQWRARVPTVCDNFFGNPESDDALRECLGFLYEGDPAAAAERLRRDRVRWVVLLPPHPDEIRAESAILGRDPSDLVDAEGRLRPAFARTAWGVLGRWAMAASPGDVGPMGLRLLDRIVEKQPGTGEIEAEILVLETAPPVWTPPPS